MNIEYELKVLEVDSKQLVKKLTGLGLEQHPAQSFRRYVYQLGTEGAWARLRTDGNKSMLTYKRFVENTIDGMKELEIEVSDFAKTHELMQALGFTEYIYQENRRTNFTKPGVEISIDEWPLIPAYAEIEAKDKQTVEEYLTKLDMGKHRTTSEPTSKIYELYELDINSYPHLSFKNS